MVRRLGWSAGVGLLLSASRCCGAPEPGYPPFSKLGTPNEHVKTEDVRLEWMHKLHGSWPPPKVYPGGRPRQETAGWAKKMDAREAELKQMEDIQARWELYLDLSQMRLLQNFTASGWATTTLDPDVHKEVVEAYKNRKATENEQGGGHLHLYIEGDREFWDINQGLPSGVYKRLIAAIQRKLAEWVNLQPSDLVNTAAYGARIYKRGSVLKSHVDHLETHVLSAVYCIDIQGEDKGAEPWYLGAFPDFLGEDAKVDLRPGQLFLYESAKLPHARPGVFHGDSYTAMFVHYKPTDWSMTRFDRVYALPEGWSDEPERNEF